MLAAAVALLALVVAGVVVTQGEDNPPAPNNPAAPAGEASGDGSGTSAQTQSAEVPADWVSYRDPEIGWTISHPPDWTTRRNGTLTDFRDPATGAYLRVDYTRSPGPSPEADWEAFEPRFAAENPGYRRIQITPTTYAGYRAAIWEFTYGGGEQLRAVDLGFVTDRYGFALNFQTRAGDWDRYQPVFDAFKASFRAPA